MKSSLFILFPLVLLLTAMACDEPTGNNPTPDDTISGAYNPQPYNLEIPGWFPQLPATPDNPLTVDGVALGQMLFYEPLFSSDGSMSCSTCHKQEHGFTDAMPVSTGVLGMQGRRSSMSLVNLAYNTKGFFWDGRAATLEDQALLPVEDHIELNESWDNVVAKLKAHTDYPGLFRKAFGIEHKSEITKELAVKAIAQFERTMISGNSRYDKVVWQNQGFFTDEEERGRMLFFFEFAQNLDHPGCSHCHFAPFFTDNNFKNNGLDSVANLTDFADLGRGAINSNVYDNGKFRVPSLRNIELTGPYMHDGRFATLEEVLENYSHGGHGVSNEDVNIRTFTLTQQDKQDLIAFLKTLTDTAFINNPQFKNPFH